MVGTPGAARAYLRDCADYRSLDSALHSMQCVVADEADALLSGGYLRDVTALFVSLREASQRVLWAQSFEPALREAVEAEGRIRYEREMAAAGASGDGGEVEGAEEVAAVTARAGGDSEDVAREEFLAEIALRGSEDRGEGGGASEGRSGGSVQLRARDLESLSRRQWRHHLVRGAISRQHVFAAATMPAMSDKAPGGILMKAFPNTVWLTGQYAHRQLPGVDFEWVRVSDDTRMAELMKYVTKGVESGEHVLVFCKTVRSAEGAAAALNARGVAAAAYHKDVPAARRAQLLDAYLARTSRTDEELDGASAEEPLTTVEGELPVLVCTSSVARGVDFGRVGMVVQAEMASTAEDFLHRAGRTGRAGADGKVVSLHGEADDLITGALRQLIDQGLPIEGAFSRKRMLRKKFKKNLKKQREARGGA